MFLPRSPSSNHMHGEVLEEGDESSCKAPGHHREEQIQDCVWIREELLLMKLFGELLKAALGP